MGNPSSILGQAEKRKKRLRFRSFSELLTNANKNISSSGLFFWFVQISSYPSLFSSYSLRLEGVSFSWFLIDRSIITSSPSSSPSASDFHPHLAAIHRLGLALGLGLGLGFDLMQVLLIDRCWQETYSSFLVLLPLLQPWPERRSRRSTRRKR